MNFINQKWHSFKKGLLQKALNAEAKTAGLNRNLIMLTCGEVSYFEKAGQEPTLILLHGAGADKNNWCRFTKYLSGHHRVIIPDLPGHGDSVRSLSLSYTITQQALYLHELLSRLNVGAIHLVGHSMGGAVALRYAHLYPTGIQSLILIDAAGAEKTPSEMRQEIEQTGIHPMMAIESTADYKKLIRYGMNKPPYIPDFFLELLAADKISRREIERKVFHDVILDLDQTPILPTLNLPVLIIWGRLDRVVHVNDAEILHELLPDSQRIILDDIGHVPMIEAPQLTAQLCLKFWNGTFSANDCEV